jgi:hypothetical protein
MISKKASTLQLWSHTRYNKAKMSIGLVEVYAPYKYKYILAVKRYG